MRIYLIGFMGSGKSTLGAHVAAQLNVPFADTDLMIEEQAGSTISHIFAERGEDHFRETEARILRQTEEIQKGIIACGGGLPVYHLNMQWILEHGISIYLRLPEDILLATLVQHRSLRPLLSDLSVEEAMNKAIELLEKRKPVYEQASMTIEMTGVFDEDARLLEKACTYIF